MKPFYKEKYPHLFSPMFIGKKKLEFKHRILTSPMGSAVGTMDFQGRINDAGVDYYTQFARGGFASVTVPIEIPANGGHAFALSLDESAGGYAFMHNMQRSVHMFRTRTLCELYHAGCCMLPGPGRTVMSASAFTYNGHPVKEMDEKDMEDVARLYADAAFLAKRANFDGICLHYGHGWLMNNFLSPLSNHRTDQYGGPVENRVRFPRRVIERVREAIGDDMIIELRMNGSDRMEGGITPEDAARQALLFEDLVDMIHVSCGTRLDASGRPKMHPTCFVPDAHNADASEALKKAGVKVPVGVVGNVHDPDLAERLLAEGKADYILMARQAIADSDWVNKVRENRVEDIRPCIRCDYCIDGGRRGSLTTEVNIRKDATFDCHCSVNPLFRQGAHKPRALRPTSKKRVAVIGGGISGMQAALSAAQRGHEVVLLEKSGKLGGQTFFADHMWFKNRIRAFREYLITQIKKSGVTVMMNVEATPGMIAEMDPDAVVVAVGGKPATPPVPGAENARQAWDVFGREEELGKKVVIVGGGSVGCELAIHLAGKGHSPVILEMGAHLAPTAEISERMSILEFVEKNGIAARTSARCLEITDKGVTVEEKDGKNFIEADDVILCTGTLPLAEVRDSFRDTAFDVISVGDCEKVGTIRTAVESGWNAGAVL
ncbi:MAG TPA: FAD-dependent oxidoreductase [Candidatus Mailhella excrementigallinarum]|mgnify:FL=1|nr:FAD-dependent oxidoreductase [Candidatus Mailhella excrementigallinarum]